MVRCSVKVIKRQRKYVWFLQASCAWERVLLKALLKTSTILVLSTIYSPFCCRCGRCGTQRSGMFRKSSRWKEFGKVFFLSSNIPSYVWSRRQCVQMCSSPISLSRLTQLIHHYKAEPLLLSCVPLPLRVIYELGKQWWLATMARGVYGTKCKKKIKIYNFLSEISCEIFTPSFFVPFARSLWCRTLQHLHLNGGFTFDLQRWRGRLVARCGLRCWWATLFHNLFFQTWLH